MPASADAAPFVPLFPSNEVPGILAAVLSSCGGLRKRDPLEHENPLTYRLYCMLIQLPQYRDGPIQPHWESWVVDPDACARESPGRADIRFCCPHGIRVYFAIEAKRLHVTSANGRWSSLVREYVDDGMMRFVSGRYAPHMESGAMLGYVFDGDTVKARAGVDKAVSTNAVLLRLAPSGHLAPSTVLPGHPVDETRHDLSGRPFTLYHLLVPV